MIQIFFRTAVTAYFFTSKRQISLALLVVIGTIALLLGILFPALRGAVASSRKTTELNYLKELNKAWTMYSSSASS